MINLTEAYLQKAWGESIWDFTLNDVKLAIQETKEMDDEHGAFWIGGIVNNEENILEVHKDLLLFGEFGENPTEKFKKKAKSWEEVLDLYSIFLTGDLSALKEWFIKE